MQGIWTSLVTPFDFHGALDLGVFRRLLQEQREAGVAGVVIGSFVGEGPTLSLDEKKVLIQTAMQEFKDTPQKVLVAAGGSHTSEVVDFSQWASDQGVEGVLLPPPSCHGLSQKGIEVHFRAVADAVNCQVVLWNDPKCPGVGLSVQTICALAAHPRVSAIQDCSGDMEFVSTFLDALVREQRHLDLFAGDDTYFLPFLSLGAVGAISQAANVIPRTMNLILKHMDSGHHREALKVYQQLFPLLRVLSREAGPVVVKYVLALLGQGEVRVRLPFVPLSTGEIEEIDATLARCGIARGRAL